MWPAKVRMRGRCAVPYGFDSFGMPAENAPSQGGTLTSPSATWPASPRRSSGWVSVRLGPPESHDPNYYRTSGFSQFLNKAWPTASKHRQLVRTVHHRVGQRAGRRADAGDATARAIQKDMSQWFLDLPKYAQELVDGLDTIDFPEHVSLLQKDWLGRRKARKSPSNSRATSAKSACSQPVRTLVWRYLPDDGLEHPMAAGLMAGRPRSRFANFAMRWRCSNLTASR